MLEPELGVLVVGAQLNGPPEHFLGPVRVPPAKQHFAEMPVDVRVAGGDLAGSDEHLLRVGVALDLHVHPGNRQQDGGIVRQPLRRELSYLLDERPVRIASQGVAQGNRRGRAWVRLPVVDERFDRVGHASGGA